MCGEDQEFFSYGAASVWLDSRDSETAPPLLESVLSGLCLVIVLELVECVMWAVWGEG